MATESIVNRSLLGRLRLLRPANIVTAIADILLGYAVAYGVLGSEERIPWTGDLFWLIVATIGLYGGGVTLNDFFDAEIDGHERPERPIPSGAVSEKAALLQGVALLLAGVAAAAQVSSRSAAIACAVALLALAYDAYGKHLAFWGPLNMGACRGGNVLLGMSVLPLSGLIWWVALTPVIFIYAVTLISRGEVSGGRRSNLLAGFSLYGLTVLYIVLITAASRQIWPFLALFLVMILPPLWRALRHPAGPNVGKAVKAGVLGLILMNASLAAAFAGWSYALLMALLLPFSLVLARAFAVT
jgi:4-hydroxybenzoate polyprenyltransferase